MNIEQIGPDEEEEVPPEGNGGDGDAEKKDGDGDDEDKTQEVVDFFQKALDKLNEKPEKPPVVDRQLLGKALKAIDDAGLN